MTTVDLSPFLSFLTATAVGLGLAVATFLVARRSGLNSVQTQLIDTLQDNAEALGKRVDLLEEEVSTLTRQRSDLEATVKRLRDAVTDLAQENADLRRRLKLPPVEVNLP